MVFLNKFAKNCSFFIKKSADDKNENNFPVCKDQSLATCSYFDKSRCANMEKLPKISLKFA